MNNPVTFDDEGAHFRISYSEFEALENIAEKEYGSGLPELPIGRTMRILSTVIYASSDSALIVDDNGHEIMASDMDGEEAVLGAMQKAFEPLIKRSVVEIGRVTVNVVNNEETDINNAESLFEFEVLSRAYKWAQQVVKAHSNALQEDNDRTPSLSHALTTEMPETGETSLEILGLKLNRNPNPAYIQIVRAPKPQ